MNKKTRIRIRKFHRISSVILGVQLSFWVLSGVYFSVVPIETVRGRDKGALHGAKPKVFLLNDVVPISKLILPNSSVSKVILKDVPGVGLLYFVQTPDRRLIYDATTGNQKSFLEGHEIEKIARIDFKPEVKSEVTLISEQPPSEYKGQLPVYQVKFADARETRLYLDPLTGELLARRNTYWRVFDFFWRLHVLDFDEGENINNQLLRTLAIASVFVLVTGYLIFFTTARIPLKIRNIFGSQSAKDSR